MVEPLDLEIGRNEFFSILGPSGCGKTTLMRMITGFEAPTAGSIELDGAVVDRVPTRQRDLNMLFQSYALFPHLTVYENVAFELRVRRTPKAELDRRVREALELVRLGDFAKRKPAELSGGQRQRVALARAVVGRPAVVLLDEPLGALDQKLRKEMQFELKRLQREVGITFIYVTHDQEEALTMSDRIAVMNRGRVLQVASPTEIYDAPASRFVASFIGSCNLFDAAVVDGSARQVVVPGLGPVPAVAPERTSAGPVVLAVRPERVSLSATEIPGGIEGLVTERVFLGDEWIYRVRTAIDGPVLSARVPSGDLTTALAGVPDGGPVWISWPDAAGLVLPADAEGEGA
ncbi:MAG: ABC transporter ATP-binding protein [Nocardioides sp.]